MAMNKKKIDTSEIEERVKSIPDSFEDFRRQYDKSYIETDKGKSFTTWYDGTVNYMKQFEDDYNNRNSAFQTKDSVNRQFDQRSRSVTGKLKEIDDYTNYITDNASQFNNVKDILSNLNDMKKTIESYKNVLSDEKDYWNQFSDEDSYNKRKALEKDYGQQIYGNAIQYANASKSAKELEALQNRKPESGMFNPYYNESSKTTDTYFPVETDRKEEPGMFNPYYKENTKSGYTETTETNPLVDLILNSNPLSDPQSTLDTISKLSAEKFVEENGYTRDIVNLQNDLDRYKKIKTDSIFKGYLTMSGTADEVFNNAESVALAELKKDHPEINVNSIDEFSAYVNSQKTSFNQQKNAENNAIMETDALSSDDFDSYANKGALLPNNKVERGRSQSKLNDARRFASGNSIRVIKEETYEKMTDEQVRIYDYYLAKENEGLVEKGTASDYLLSIEQSLNQSVAEDITSNLNTDFEKSIYNITASPSLGRNDTINYFKGMVSDNNYMPYSVEQLAYAMNAEALDRPDNEVGKVVTDTLSAAGRMLPSIEIGAAMSAIGLPQIGSYLASVQFGSMAAGQEYQEAINNGMDRKTAKVLSTAEGIWEAVSEKMLGSIPFVGGENITKTILGSIGKGMNSAIYKLSSLGLNMATEGLEEIIQDIGASTIKKVITGETDIASAEELAYEGMVGALMSFALSGAGVGVDIASDYLSNVKTGKEAYKLMSESGIDVTQDIVTKGLSNKENTFAYNESMKAQKKLDKGQMPSLSNIGSIINESGKESKSNVTGSKYVAIASVESIKNDKVSEEVADSILGNEYAKKEIESVTGEKVDEFSLNRVIKQYADKVQESKSEELSERTNYIKEIISYESASDTKKFAYTLPVAERDVVNYLDEQYGNKITFEEVSQTIGEYNKAIRDGNYYFAEINTPLTGKISANDQYAIASSVKATEEARLVSREYESTMDSISNVLGEDYNGELPLSNGSDWYDRESTGIESEGVAEGTGTQNEKRRSGFTPKDTSADNVKIGKVRTTAKEQGFKNGDDNKSTGFYIVEGNYTDRMKEIDKKIKDRGLKSVFFYGSNISFNNGKSSARAFIDEKNGTVYIRVDHPKYDAYELGMHELTHNMINNGELNVDECLDNLKTILEDDYDALVREYIYNYENTGKSERAVMEEMICDLNASMNVFERENIQNVTEKAFAKINADVKAKNKDTLGLMYSMETDREYMELAKDPKKNWAKLYDMVIHAAVKNGYTNHVYHGTDKFGFTKFDLKKMDDKISIFATNSKLLASGYAYLTDERTREIGKSKGVPYGETFMNMSRQELLNALNSNTLGINPNYVKYKINADGKFEMVDPYAIGREFITEQSVRFQLVSKATRGIYDLVGRMDNMLVIDAHESRWNNIDASNIGLSNSATTREIAAYAKKKHYRGVVIKNVYDSNTSRTLGEMSDVSIYFNEKDLKSLDLVTYDDKGNIIPLSKRFNRMKNEIRFSEEIANDNENKVRFGSMFSGSGLVDFALRNVISSQFALEKFETIAAAFRLNNGNEIFVGDIESENAYDYIFSHKDNLDYVHISPVCKNFSGAKTNADELPVDISTAKASADHIKTVKPKFVTVENVPKYKDSKAIKIIEKALEESGYIFDKNVYSAYDYGGSTTRERMFLRAVRSDVMSELPSLPAKTEGKSWYEVTKDLIPTLEETHVPKWMQERIDKMNLLDNQKEPIIVLHGNKNGLLSYAIASDPSPTVLASDTDTRIFMPDGRVLRATPRVIARIQGLPDSFKLSGSMTNQFKVLGNGVPVELTQSVAGSLLKATDEFSDIQFSEELDSEYMKLSSDTQKNESRLREIVDEYAKSKGFKYRVYHGTSRADRVGNVFRSDRATSGPMAFFTDNKTIAESYSRSKRDTSMSYDSDYDSYETQFRAKTKYGSKNSLDMPIHKAWGYIDILKRNEIKTKAGQVRENWDGDGELIVDKNNKEANGGFQWQLERARGNVISALEEQWLNSGNLFNDEGRFLDVLKMTGITDELSKVGFDVEYKDPSYAEEKVYDSYVKMDNPFVVTENVNNRFAENFLKWANKNDSPKYHKESASADFWDKNNVTAELFYERLIDSPDHAFTSIPDVATDYIKHLGYDGIIDQGGKNGGVGHTVYIPFYSNQVKSADLVTYDDNGNIIPLSERFNNEKDDIRYSQETRGNGYDGYSMSNNARDAYDNDERPLSKWSRTELLSIVESVSPRRIDAAKKLNINQLRGAVLRKSSWHHTSKYYNNTDFYSVDYDKIDRIGTHIDSDKNGYFKLYEDSNATYNYETREWEYDGEPIEYKESNVMYSQETDSTGRTNSLDEVQFSEEIKDNSLIDFLNEQYEKGEYDPKKNPDGGYYVTYKSMSFWGYDENGHAILRSPMAEYVDGKLSNPYIVPNDGEPLKWYVSTETIDKRTGIPKGLKVKVKGDNGKDKFVSALAHPELISDDWSNLYFSLKKRIGGKTSDVPARYNPYEHSSNVMLNDQFSSAYKRPNLVTVKMVVPVSEDGGTFRAKYSKDATGWSEWKAGIVAGKIAEQKEDFVRNVYLSRYAAPIEIVSNKEVAKAYKEYIDGTDVYVPWNVVSPDLRKELVNAGVNVSYADVTMGKTTQKFEENFPGEKYSEELPQKDYSVRISELKSVITDLKRELNKQTKRAEHFKGQFKKTEGFNISDKSLNKITSYIKSEYKVNEDYSDRIRKIINKEMNGEIDGNTFEANIQDLAWDIARNSQKKSEQYNTSTQIINFIRNRKTGIIVTESMKNDIIDFADFRTMNFGRIRMQNGDKTNIHEIYAELRDEFKDDSLFPAIDNETDMLLQISQAIDSTRTLMYENVRMKGREVEDISEDIMETMAINLAASKPTYADKVDEKIKRIKEEAKTQKEKELNDLRRRREERIQKLKDSNQESRRKERENRLKSELRGKIKKYTKELSDKLLKPTDKSHVPQKFRKVVAKFLDAIQIVSVDSEGNADYSTKVSQAFQNLQAEYLKILNNEEEVYLVKDYDLEQMFDDLSESYGTPIGAMSYDQLNLVYNIVSSIKKMIETEDKMFNSERWENVSGISYALHEENSIKSQKVQYVPGLESVHNLATLNMLTPEAYFHRLGETGDYIFRMLRNAQDKSIRILQEIEQYQIDNGLDKIPFDKLEKEVHENIILGGKKISMTTAQIMELYNLSKRKYGLQHILTGGVKISQRRTKGLKVEWNADPIKNITMEELENLFPVIGYQNQHYADLMQEFVNGYLSRIGNEASMEVYNYKKFVEENYWPILTNNDEIETDVVDENALATSFANKGFTKRVKPNAQTSVKIGSVFNTYSKHCIDMMNYAAFLSTMEDVNRIRNYRSTFGTIKADINRVHGQKGSDYLQKLMQDIANPGATERSLFSGLTSKYKSSAVSANMRVIIQQPTAILRALYIIDAKYLNPFTVKDSFKAFEESKKYAPISAWKDYGYFDINTGKQIKDILFKNGNIIDKVNEKMMMPASKADSFAWGCLWNAVKNEQKALNPKMDTKSEEFLTKCGERFTEIIDRSQVVDGVLQRSQIMRSKNELVKMSTSFMGEPIKQYNMLMTAIYDVKNGNDPKMAKKILARTTMSVLFAGIINAIAQSLVDAIRDKDDEEYYKKFLNALVGDYSKDDMKFGDYLSEAATSNIGDFLNPLGYIPFAKDILSLFEGYDVERMDISSIADVISASKVMIKAFGNGTYTVPYAITNFIAQASKLLGIPVSNIKRDMQSILNTFAQETNNYGIKYHTMKFTYNVKNTNNISKFTELMISAFTDGDTDAFDMMDVDLVMSGIDQEKYNNSLEGKLKKILRESYGTDDALYNRTLKELKSRGLTDDAIRSTMESQMKKDQKVESVDDLESRYMTPDEQKEYDSIFGDVEKNKLWSKATEEQKSKIEDKMFNLATESLSGIKMQEKIDSLNGIDTTEYLLYQLALQMVDKPNENGNLGTYNAEEREAAIRMLGLSRSESYTLYHDSYESDKNNPWAK